MTNRVGCVTCDGAGRITPTDGDLWPITGETSTDCPVCCGPHLRWLVDKIRCDEQVIVCSSGACETQIDVGWIVYAQIASLASPEVDEMIALCCDDHADDEALQLMKGGHPTVCLPFTVNDVKAAT